jgi:hypothetical protein
VDLQTGSESCRASYLELSNPGILPAMPLRVARIPQFPTGTQADLHLGDCALGEVLVHGRPEAPHEVVIHLKEAALGRTFIAEGCCEIHRVCGWFTVETLRCLQTRLK